MPVVRCQDILGLKRQWDDIVAKHRQQVPNARFVQDDAQIQQLARNLADHPRIQWFFYTDGREGIALRLYDEPFSKLFPNYFQEPLGQNGQEWVILRGHDLGGPQEACKQEMRAAFGTNLWHARRAPNPRGIPVDTTNNRLRYFQDEHHNNSEIPPPPPATDGDMTLMNIIRQFGQVILYGPPGTGKTRDAKRAALELLSGSPPPVGATAVEIERELRGYHEAGRYEIVVFHPAYEYEQFVGGVEPTVYEGKLVFKKRPGVFLRLCRRAEGCRPQPAVLIIDEINRGSLPKLLGELVHALEYRDHRVTLPFDCDGRTDLVVPGNLYVIATMNSSDSSIGHIDVAIRRRFGLVHVGPDPEVVRTVWRNVKLSQGGDWAEAANYGDRLARCMTDLNSRLGGEDRAAEVELGVGHSYFLPNPGSFRDDALKQVKLKWEYQVQPLLHQYAEVLNLGKEFFRDFRDLPAPPA